MTKRFSIGFYIFTRKNKRCDVSLSILHIRPSAFIFQRPSNSINKESKNILFLNALAKDQDARGISCHLALMGNCPTCCHIYQPINRVNGLLIVRPRSCEGHEISWSRGRCLVRRIWT